ncbi:MAG: hypothetical protein PHQ95_03285 [Candidatus Gracilibacteria bacterium]|nr:hypothetical protein [Candidatus Gracilibacteria bacterium]
MFWLGFGVYTIFMVLIFGFFIITKIHVYKFRYYNTNIELVTKILATVLLALALVGYYLLFSEGIENTTTQTVGESTSIEIY